MNDKEVREFMLRTTSILPTIDMFLALVVYGAVALLLVIAVALLIVDISTPSESVTHSVEQPVIEVEKSN